MHEPARVAECVAAMRAAVRAPVTVKMRIGVADESAGGVQDALERFGERDAERLWHFVASVRDAGCQAAIVHARTAVLGGLSPKDNRSEERRVGKECRSRWAPYHLKKKK